MTPAPIQQWHAYLETLDAGALKALLAEDVVFESPVVHTPQAGRPITMKYLLGAAAVLNNPSFHYENEWFSERSAVLEFVTEIDGIKINGVDIIHWNDAGQITRFKVMVRPLKAINLLHQQMGAMLASMAG
ncbi:MAG: nuclear transport factor 2 family protein [Caulobacter sp.]|nr:nuclear transport factor 2 family protein [Caulobacter sp.]